MEDKKQAKKNSHREYQWQRHLKEQARVEKEYQEWIKKGGKPVEI
jgi:hypothetical protein